MARRRMFSLEVTETDKFMDMPTSAQALYFHLGLHGDDEGFVSSPKRIARSIGSCDDDLRLLAAKNFIIPFDSGIIVITDWAKNNTLKNDRFHATDYKAEKHLLTKDESGRYQLGTNMEPERNQLGTNVEPEHNITELNLTKENNILGKRPAAKPQHTKKKGFIPPSVDEVVRYCKQRNNNVDAQRFCDFYDTNGWVQGRGKPIRDWKAAVRTWERKEDDIRSPNKYTFAEEESL